MPKWINIVIVLVAIVIVSAVLTVAVNGQPAENDPRLQSFGVFILFLAVTAILVTAFIIGRLFPWKKLDGEASRTLASSSSQPDSGRPYSEVEHSCTTRVRQVGTGHTEFCGGKTVVGGEEE